MALPSVTGANPRARPVSRTTHEVAAAAVALACSTRTRHATRARPEGGEGGRHRGKVRHARGDASVGAPTTGGANPVDVRPTGWKSTQRRRADVLTVCPCRTGGRHVHWGTPLLVTQAKGVPRTGAPSRTSVAGSSCIGGNRAAVGRPHRIPNRRCHNPSHGGPRQSRAALHQHRHRHTTSALAPVARHKENAQLFGREQRRRTSPRCAQRQRPQRPHTGPDQVPEAYRHDKAAKPAPRPSTPPTCRQGRFQPASCCHYPCGRRRRRCTAPLHTETSPRLDAHGQRAPWHGGNLTCNTTEPLYDSQPDQLGKRQVVPPACPQEKN